MGMKLKRINQCAKCPWKVSTDPREIPYGYCEVKHSNLSQTIADPGKIDFTSPLRIMACHHSNGRDEMYCIGWLHNQIGRGNNIMLRIAMLKYVNADKIRIYGPQHEKFEDTLPKPQKE